MKQMLGVDHVCPHCGYCPHCGRGGYPVRPYPYIAPYPYYPHTQPYWYKSNDYTTNIKLPDNKVRC